MANPGTIYAHLGTGTFETEFNQLLASVLGFCFHQAKWQTQKSALETENGPAKQPISCYCPESQSCNQDGPWNACAYHFTMSRNDCLTNWSDLMECFAKSQKGSGRNERNVFRKKCGKFGKMKKLPDPAIWKPLTLHGDQARSRLLRGGGKMTMSTAN